MSRMHMFYAATPEPAPARAGDCIGDKCPCATLAKRLTWTQRAALAVMVVGIIGFVMGLAERLGAF